MTSFVDMPFKSPTTLYQLCFIFTEAYWLYVDFYTANTKLNMTEKEFTMSSRSVPYSLSTLTKSPIILHINLKFQYTVLSLTHVVALTDYHNNHYDFPKGKRNQDEKDYESAIREVYEEIGYDITSKLKEEKFIIVETFKNKLVKLYVIADVPKDSVQIAN